MHVDPQTLILETLAQKSVVKQKVYENTLAGFKTLKSVCKYIAQNTRKSLKDINPKIACEYKESGAFQIEFTIAGDLLLFSMHTNVFVFDRSHPVWKTPALNKDPYLAYCGVINIYNFLADSFRYNRSEDIGYLIGRIFINKENHFMVEGKRQLGVLYNNFTTDVVDMRSLRNVVQSAILYSLDFDLLVPPYEQSAFITVGQIQERKNRALEKTGKRLGFRFYDENEFDHLNP